MSKTTKTTKTAAAKKVTYSEAKRQLIDAGCYRFEDCDFRDKAPEGYVLNRGMRFKFVNAEDCEQWGAVYTTEDHNVADFVDAAALAKELRRIKAAKKPE